MPRQTIHDLKANDEVHSVFLLSAAELRQKRNGQPYWRLELRDATGKLEANIWDAPGDFSDLAAGQMVNINGRVSLFRDQLQVTVEDLSVLTDEERNSQNLNDFLPASPRPAADMLADAEDLCRAELTYTPWRNFALTVLKDEDIRERLQSAPAAKNIHHAYVGGLLEHMLSVARLCLSMADHYPELDRQTLLTAALFHDIGKLDEMEGGLSTEYTDAGRLLGHIVQGLARLEPFLADAVESGGLEPGLALHFRHLIASHHGELEFGSPRQPATAEAFILHHADNVDAKVAQWRALFSIPAGKNTEDCPPLQGLEWSPWQSTLGRSLCRPPRTPEKDDSAASQAGNEAQGTAMDPASASRQQQGSLFDAQPSGNPEN